MNIGLIRYPRRIKVIKAITAMMRNTVFLASIVAQIAGPRHKGLESPPPMINHTFRTRD